MLASQLVRYASRPNLLILALPRGGVPVGFEIARTLHAPLDIFLVRKLGVPGQEELAMGAVASGNVRVLQSDVVEAFRIPKPPPFGPNGFRDRCDKTGIKEACIRRF